MIKHKKIITFLIAVIIVMGGLLYGGGSPESGFAFMIGAPVFVAAMVLLIPL